MRGSPVTNVTRRSTGQVHFFFGGVACALVGALIGCATASPRQPTGLAEKTFWADQARRAAKLRHVNGSMGVRYKTKQTNVGGRGRIASSLGEGLRLEVRDPLGRVRFLVVLRGARFVAHYPSEKKAYVDSEHGTRYLRQFLGVGASFEELQDLFFGVLPRTFEVRKLENWDWDGSKGAYVGTARLPQGGALRVWVHPVHGAIELLQAQRGNDVVEVQYSDFSPCCGKGSPALANVVVLEPEHRRTSITAEWDDLSPVARIAPSTFSWSAPEDTTITELE